MRLLVSGSSGLIGSALSEDLEGQGVEVVRLLRGAKPEEKEAIYWQPESGVMDKQLLEGFDAIVHLAGENVADGRWTDEKRKLIKDSRVRGTTLLCETLAKVSHRPKVIVSASAVGFYGDRGERKLLEDDHAGRGFLADVCQQWEQATQAAAQNGIRIVNIRIGIVLSVKGGALAKMITPFKWGLGGVLGTGTQYMSWITLDDVVKAIEHVVETPGITGPVNVVAPNPVTNQEFTKTLAMVLNRPALFPVPAVVLQMLLGEMANELLLASARVEPGKLIATNFNFRQRELETALRELVSDGR